MSTCANAPLGAYYHTRKRHNETCIVRHRERSDNTGIGLYDIGGNMGHMNFIYFCDGITKSL